MDKTLQLTVNVKVTGQASNPDDEGVQGTYGHTVKLTRSADVNELTPSEEGAIAEAVLDSFHNHQGIECLDDFDLDVVLLSGKVIQELDDDAMHDGALVKTVSHDGMVESSGN